MWSFVYRPDDWSSQETLSPKGVTDGYDTKYVKETLSTEVDTIDVYRNLVVDGINMIASSTWTNHLCISLMQEKFNTYLSTEDQVTLDIMVK